LPTKNNLIYKGLPGFNSVSTEQDLLYIGNGSDNTVKAFDPVTGQYLGAFVVPGSGGLRGPRGLLFEHGDDLLVANQNLRRNNGNILKYSGQTGRFLGELVSSKERDGAPFAPRGMVLSDDNVLFVADFMDHGNKPGTLRAYDGTTGEFLGSLDHSGFGEQFYPRGVVIGPDGLLYVSVFNIDDQNSGWVVRFDPETGEYLGIVIESNNFNNLHRPEGLVFNPDGTKLYVTSFRSVTPGMMDTDKILVFDFDGENFVFNPDDTIHLYSIGQPRAFAQAILFGPDGKLYVPITGGDPATTGSVRVYDVESEMFVEIVPPASEGGPLGEPWYLTFGNTDPATLSYHSPEEMG
jgi:DNA-binding beta-propeller fold protein YncE